MSNAQKTKSMFPRKLLVITPWGILALYLSILGSAGAFAQDLGGLAEQQNVVISATVTGSDHGIAPPGAKLGLQVSLSRLASSSTIPLNSIVLPYASILRENGSPKHIEVIAWLNPRHFSLYSHRHGILTFDEASDVFGQHSVYAIRHTEADDEDTSKKLQIRLRKAAPLNETTNIGVLLWCDERIIAELSVPLTISKELTVSENQALGSPFRPRITNDAPDDGVLTLIELHPGHVQLTFSSSAEIVSWRVANKRTLADWPKYVDEGIAGSELATASSNFGDVLFPADSRCEEGDCAAAALKLSSWARRASYNELVPTLTVQALPIEDDETFSPVLMPVGILPIVDEIEDLTSGIGDSANSTTTASIPDPSSITADASEAISDLDNLETITNPSFIDPADPGLAVNQLPTASEDPVEKLQRENLSSTIIDAVSNSEHSENYLAFKVVVNAPLYRYRAASTQGTCANAWSILVPPDIEDPRGGLDSARKQMRALLDIWDSMPLPRSFQYERSLTSLENDEVNQSRLTNSWLIVSHYDNVVGALLMPRATGGMQTVGIKQLRRKIAPPGVVLLLACQTAVPATHSFLVRLLDNGTTTLISTNSLLPGIVAGQFATAFMGVLGEAGPEGITAEDAFREALRRLPSDSQYAVPRFVLSGNPNVRLCAPPLTR